MTAKLRLPIDDVLPKLAQALNAGSKAVVGFVVNPILVRYLGDVTFGQWQVLYRLVGQTNPAGGRPSGNAGSVRPAMATARFDGRWSSSADSA